MEYLVIQGNDSPADADQAFAAAVRELVAPATAPNS
jgi:hypothetical protein